MKFLHPFKPLIRWFNLLPLWRLGTVRLWGHRLRAPTFDRWLCLMLHRVGLMGKADYAFLSALLRPSWTVVDIGANQGLYSLLFSQLVGPDGRVLAFEPDDMLYGALCDNLARNDVHNVQTYHLALGSESGTMTLHRSLLNSGDNRLSAQHDGGPTDEIQVRVSRLDQILENVQIDFIKMDVQGWEMEVFRGMENLLAARGNEKLAIHFEFWPQGLIGAGSDPLEPLTFLAERGFGLFQMKDNELLAIHDIHAFVHSTNSSAYANLFASRPSASVQEQMTHRP